MTSRKTDFISYLFALSNFIAALGGGMILGKGMGIINLSYLRNGSMLAFFIGTILGLAFLQWIPEYLSKKISKWFSICGGLSSIALIFIFESYANNQQLIDIPALFFFLFLSIRFGFWFYSRVMRAATVAGQEQRIAWVEFGYYAGIMLGLIVWKLLQININLTTALMIDAVFQFLAGLIDLLCNRLQSITHAPQDKNAPIDTLSNFSAVSLLDSIWSWRLSSAVVFLTIAVQVIIFDLAHSVSESMSVYILAVFYLGVAVAAIFCKKFNVCLSWQDNHVAVLYAVKNKNKIKINILLLFLLSAAGVLGAIIVIQFGLVATFDLLSIAIEFFAYLFIFMASFIYEILSLAILDRIGVEEQSIQKNGLVMRAYGLMGIGAAISLTIFGIIHHSLILWISTLMFSFSMAIFSILKRPTEWLVTE